MPSKKAPAQKIVFTSAIGRFNSNLWAYHFLVPKQKVSSLIDKNNKRVVCTLNSVHTFQCALMPHGDGDYFINVNKSIRDKLDLKEGDKVSIELESDTSEFGLPMPEELSELLKMDDEGNAIFNQLTKGKQRTLLYLIAKPKNVDLRIRRALCVVNHLKENAGKIDYKLLNACIKNSKMS
jgi:bifunctional DNA-binding transcriptional regulator/antitoxin component of YhaV-PrlF toxin-antitoxin module